jgi:hypothetical protein
VAVLLATGGCDWRPGVSAPPQVRSNGRFTVSLRTAKVASDGTLLKIEVHEQGELAGFL